VKERRYWIALFNEGGESAGVERELARHDRLDPARSIYRQMVATYPTRLVMLCDRARVLARSDRPATMSVMRGAGWLPRAERESASQWPK
jgi:hypothetical protein